MVKIHFLNVGHGDCTIIEHASGNTTVIDINNGEELDDKSAAEIAETLNLRPEDVYNQVGRTGETPYEILKASGYQRKLENPVDYIKNSLSVSNIFRYIQTHPDLDHMRGIHCLSKEGISIWNFWDTDHNKELEEFLFPDDEAAWKEYQLFTSGGKGATVLKLNRNAIGQHFNSHPELGAPGDGLYILAPTPALAASANNNKKWNNHSYVLMLKYKGSKVIFGGDAEEEVWDSILDAHSEELSGCSILKASHHGRDSGFHYEAVKQMNPEFTIVSVGKKPETDASNKYRPLTKKGVWSTRWKGNITLTIDEDGTAVISSQYDN